MDKNRTQRISAVMFMIAGVVFLLTAALGEAGGETVFLVLGLAMVVLSLNAWRISRTKPDESSPASP